MFLNPSYILESQILPPQILIRLVWGERQPVNALGKHCARARGSSDAGKGWKGLIMKDFGNQAKAFRLCFLGPESCCEDYI